MHVDVGVSPVAFFAPLCFLEKSDKPLGFLCTAFLCGTPQTRIEQINPFASDHIFVDCPATITYTRMRHNESNHLGIQRLLCQGCAKQIKVTPQSQVKQQLHNVQLVRLDGLRKALTSYLG